MEEKRFTVKLRYLYMLILIVASIPLSCAYVMEGGEVLTWLTKIEEIKNNFVLVQHDPWLMFPTGLRVLGVSITTTYRLYMLLLNTLSVITIKMMMEEIFEEKMVIFIGVLLYMLSPYRVYILYDKADFAAIAAWVVIPLYICGIQKLIKKENSVRNIIITSLSLATIGYAQHFLFFATILITVLALICYRKLSILIPMFIGIILFLPRFIYLLNSFWQGEEAFLINNTSIKGYVIGQLFTTWTYRKDYPGFGMGIVISFFVLLCFSLEKEKSEARNTNGFFSTITLLFLFLSMTSFGGNMIPRNVFFGVASFSVTVLAVRGIRRVMEEKKSTFQLGIPLFIIISTTAIYVYMCNTLTYYRMPMFLIDTL